MPEAERSPLRSLLTGFAAAVLLLVAIRLVLWLCGWRFWGLE